MVEKFSDEWFMQYAIDEINGKHKHKPIRKLVKCINCKFCSIGKLGDLECQKKLHGKQEVGWEEFNLSNKMAVAKRYCDGFEI